ncbi:GDSL-type esterase/lipase family protein [Lentzea sp. HUAS TT2]|uniref:GDSL-type esterase/lipase family protein n=1 Tax=Lentzea sp. HUAS TT2 TaxID=3447454 RepID=UPI003F6E95F4
MRVRDRGRVFDQVLTLGAALAVVCAVAPGAVAVAKPGTPQLQQQQQQQHKSKLKIVVVGDSYTAGEAVHGERLGRGATRGGYFDPQDPRHQSMDSPAMQAVARLQAANPGLEVEVHVVAASGATTSDVFETQRRDPLEKVPGNRARDPLNPSTMHEENDLAVNHPQLGQIPKDADAVIVGLGGNDVLFGPLAESFVRGDADKTRILQEAARQLLDTGKSDQDYRDQADESWKGQAPTVIARLLQVWQAIRNQAPNAELFFPNYPMAIDPAKNSWFDGMSPEALAEMRKFGERVNQALKRAEEICGCGTTVDLADALKGRELNSDDPAITGIWPAITGSSTQWASSEPFHPNRAGAGLISDRISEALARKHGLRVPPKQGAGPTDTSKVTIKRYPAPDTDGDGRPDYRDSDWDGDGHLNDQDRNPNKPDPRPPLSRTRPDGGKPGAFPNKPAPAVRPPAASPTAPSSPTSNQAPAQPPRSAAPGENAGPQPVPHTPPRDDDQPTPQPPTPRPPTPLPPTPRQPAAPPQAPQPSTPPQQDNHTSGSKPPAARPAPKPVISPEKSMRSPSTPSTPKPPTAAGFKPDFASRAAPLSNGSVLGVKPPPAPVFTPPTRPSNPNSPYPLGSGGSKGRGGSTPPMPSKAPSPPPPPPPPPSTSLTS